MEDNVMSADPLSLSYTTNGSRVDLVRKCERLLLFWHDTLVKNRIYVKFDREYSVVYIKNLTNAGQNAGQNLADKKETINGWALYKRFHDGELPQWLKIIEDHFEDQWRS